MFVINERYQCFTLLEQWFSQMTRVHRSALFWTQLNMIRVNLKYSEFIFKTI